MLYDCLKRIHETELIPYVYGVIFFNANIYCLRVKFEKKINKQKENQIKHMSSIWPMHIKFTVRHDANSYGKFVSPWLFSVAQSIAVLWRNTNTHCDGILCDSAQEVSQGKLVLCVFHHFRIDHSCANWRIRSPALSSSASVINRTDFVKSDLLVLGSGKCRAAVVLTVMFCVCVCVNGGPDLFWGLDACLIRVICVNCGIICYASVVPAMFAPAVCCG